MPKLKVTLNIGIANAEQEDELEIEQWEIDQCATQKDKDEMFDQYWKDWAWNYIDGMFELIE